MADRMLSRPSASGIDRLPGNHTLYEARYTAGDELDTDAYQKEHRGPPPHQQLDQAVLAAYKPLGVEPGKVFDAAKVAKLDGAQLRSRNGNRVRSAFRENRLRRRNTAPRRLSALSTPSGC